MALNFPSSPTIGDVYTSGTTKWSWDGTSWNATTLGITNDTTTNATMYPTWVTATTGNLPLKTSSTKLTFNPSTGVLAATTFSGSGASLTSLPAGQLSGTIPSAVLGNSTVYIGTTAVALNRGTAALVLTGITSIDGNAATATTASATTASVTFNNGGAGAASGTTFNGSTAQTISYNTIGAAASSHTHSYLPLTGGTLTGNLSLVNGSAEMNLTLGSSGAYFYGTSTHYGIWKTSGVSLSVNASNGDFTTNGNVTAYSDARLKTDIELIPNALDKVLQLSGYTYLRMDTKERQTGLLAQDVQKVLPEAVVDTGEYLSLAYGNLVGLLVEAIKDQQKQIDELRERIK